MAKRLASGHRARERRSDCSAEEGAFSRRRETTEQYVSLFRDSPEADCIYQCCPEYQEEASSPKRALQLLQCQKAQNLRDLPLSHNPAFASDSSRNHQSLQSILPIGYQKSLHQRKSLKATISMSLLRVDLTGLFDSLEDCTGIVHSCITVYIVHLHHNRQSCLNF